MQTQIPLRVDRLGQTYTTQRGDLTVLDDISFELAAGSTCAVLGPSGSGKTTLLSLCAGLDTPQRGEVSLFGEPLHRLDEEARARLRRERLGFVFQSFQLLPSLTALENVMVPMELLGQRGAGARAGDLLAAVGLADRKDHHPAQLSGGEQQRVALARAFASQPPLLFADEPTGNLDAETGRTIIDLLFDLNRSAGTTLLLVTHDGELAGRCRRTLRLKAGRLVEDRSA